MLVTARSEHMRAKDEVIVIGLALPPFIAVYFSLTRRSVKHNGWFRVHTFIFDKSLMNSANMHREAENCLVDGRWA